MKPTIYCRVLDKGIHSFYIETANGTFFIFRQEYRKSVADHFRNGLTLNEAINFSKSKRDSAILRTMYKIPMYIKYIEKEYDIEILKQTKKKNNPESYRRRWEASRMCG